MEAKDLSIRDKDRYRRQIIIEGFGEESQARLARATVGVLGIGGLGSPATMYLAAAGVGRIILVDDQVPEMSNLNRQVLHWLRDVSASRLKVESAAWKIKEMNEEVQVLERCERVTKESISSVLDEAEIVLDCTDNFETRYALNAFCVEQRKPFVHAGVEGLYGQITTIVPGRTPCLKCLFPKAPPKKSELPILGAAAGVFGSMQAAEAIKLITGVGEPLKGQMLVGDLRNNVWERVEVQRREKCPVCSALHNQV
jgi:molybdopterin/thiamine biosynthesis adenylyltransferase